jgi:ketosteroid isomerase-like protein
VRQELSDLVHRYAVGVDARDWDAVAALFTDDAVLVVPEPPRTLEPATERTVREAMAALDGVVRTVHEVAAEVYDVAGDTATGRVTGAAHHLVERDSEPVDLCWRLRYADDYRRTPEGWRFTRRELTIDVVEVRPVQKVRR